MVEPIETLYFNWLCAKVLDRNSRSYSTLMEILFATEFVWIVPADKHRAADGEELRQDFLRRRHLRVPLLETTPCTVLEMLIAFSKRAEFQTDIPARNWFWTFLSNLGLDQFEEVSESDVPLIEDILHTFTWRIYEPNGYGGMFPLDHTNNDQREIEIWYQFCEYLAVKGLI